MAGRRLLGRGFLRRSAAIVVGRAAVVPEALLERGHQVDDVRALRRRRIGIRILDDLLALLLCFSAISFLSAST